MTWAIAIGVGVLIVGAFCGGYALGLSSAREPDLVEQWKLTRDELDRAMRAPRAQHTLPGHRAESAPSPPPLRLVDR